MNLSAGPRCGACEGMKATMRKVAETLAGVARVGTLLCDAEGGKVRRPTASRHSNSPWPLAQADSRRRCLHLWD